MKLDEFDDEVGKVGKNIKVWKIASDQLTCSHSQHQFAMAMVHADFGR